VSEEVGRISQVYLHPTLALEYLVGPEHPERRLQLVDPTMVAGILEGMQEGLVQGLVMQGRRVEGVCLLYTSRCV